MLIKPCDKHSILCRSWLVTVFALVSCSCSPIIYVVLILHSCRTMLKRNDTFLPFRQYHLQVYVPDVTTVKTVNWKHKMWVLFWWPCVCVRACVCVCATRETMYRCVTTLVHSVYIDNCSCFSHSISDIFILLCGWFMVESHFSFVYGTIYYGGISKSVKKKCQDVNR